MTIDTLNEKFPLRDSGYSNSLGSTDLARHRWYFVKEAFSPYVVERAIEDAHFEDSDIMVDPFCGSGTVPLTGSLKKRQAIGFEVNPFLAFVSQTKLHQVRFTTIDRNLSAVISKARRGKPSSLETFSSFSEAGGADKWLFNEQVLRTFEGGWSATSELRGPVRDLLRLALIGAVMDTCNATKDGKCLRYRRDWQNLNFGRSEFLNSFESRIAEIKEDVKLSPNPDGYGMVHLGDSRVTLKNHIKEKFKLCITSPPYLNSFDYSDVYRPELFLGKFIHSKEELRTLRHRTLRSHIQAKWIEPKENAFGCLYNEAVSQITARSEHLWNKRIPLMIQAYFEDIERVLRDLRNLAKPDASLWIVVSTSAYVGVEVPVDLIIGHIGSKVGWFLREVGVLRYLRSSGQRWNTWSTEPSDQKPRLRESVVILDASSTRKCKLDFPA
jgi:DNA modification methylase